jgi:hypothetical protein
VVHHPIAKGSGTHQPGFGFADRELPIGARGVSEAAQLVLELKQLGFQIGAKGEHIRPIALAARRVEKAVMRG